jgi:ApaG protein
MTDVRRGTGPTPELTTSDATTRGIRVRVRSIYVPERSSPAGDRYFFAYRIRIANDGEETAQLLSREWLITDGEGRVETVRGEGVVGEQPVLDPGDAYEYESFCPLSTPTGTMQGKYTMVTGRGEVFDARIAPFALAAEHVVN